MLITYIQGLTIPFLGTALGAATVFFMKHEIGSNPKKLMLGFASGVMVAASIWSLLIPAMDMSQDMGRLAFIPAATGFIIGMVFLFLLDIITPHLHADATKPEGPRAKLKKTTMLCLAVTLHNIPEGMAVGVVYAGLVAQNTPIGEAGALALAAGIAIQNFPEGAIISMPLAGEGNGKFKAFIYGMLSGIVEPIAAVLTICLSSLVIPVLPYLLAFAAGAMLYVVVEELIPEASQGEHSNNGTLGFASGFVLMMILDVALGA